MARIKFEGVDNYVAMLTRMQQKTPKMIDRAVEEGAGVAADEVRRFLEETPVDNSGYKPNRTKNGLNAKQKAGLLKALGITPPRDDDGFYNRKIGFDGYNDIVTKKWPKGQPNAMLARSLNNGTSFMRKTNFMGKAQKAMKTSVETTMINVIEEELRKQSQ